MCNSWSHTGTLRQAVGDQSESASRRLAVLLTANDQATVDHYFVPLTLSQPCRIIPQADLSNVVQSRPIPPPCANPRLTRAFDLLRW